MTAPSIIVYLAAPYVRKAEARTARDWLVAQGVTVNSRWLDLSEGALESADEAQRDLQDIWAAHAMIVLNLERSEGKAVEQGLVLMFNEFSRLIFDLDAIKRLIVVGERSNVFQHLPDVTMVATLEEALQVLRA